MEEYRRQRGIVPFIEAFKWHKQGICGRKRGSNETYPNSYCLS